MSNAPTITDTLRAYDAARYAQRNARTAAARTAADAEVAAADRALARHYAEERKTYGSQAEAMSPRGRAVRLGGPLDI